MELLYAKSERRDHARSGDSDAPQRHTGPLDLAGGGGVAPVLGERLDRLEILVGNGDPELLFDLEQEIDEVERIDAERGERCVRVEAFRIDRKLLGCQLPD